MEGFHSKTQALLTLVILKKILIQFFFLICLPYITHYSNSSPLHATQIVL